MLKPGGDGVGAGGSLGSDGNVVVVEPYFREILFSSVRCGRVYYEGTKL